MARFQQLGDLAARRRLLVAQSSQLREQLAEDLLTLKSSAQWAERGYSLVRSGRALLPWLAGLTGLVITRDSGGWLGKANKAWSWLRLATKARRLWTSLRAGSRRSDGS